MAKLLKPGSIIRVAVLCLLLLGSGRVCWADSPAGANGQLEAPAAGELSGQLKTDAFDTFRMMGKVILALIVIIGLFFIIMKYLAQKNKNTLIGPVRTLGGAVLGPNKSLQIVEVGRTLYVVGVGDNVQLLDKIVDAAEIAGITEATAHKRYPAGLSRLPGWFSARTSNAHPPAEEAEPAASFHEVFRQKMRNVPGRKEMIGQMLKNDKTEERSDE